MLRKDGRLAHEPRNVKITKDFILYPEGSVLIETGNTKVICNASVEEEVPRFLKGKGEGWISAEYSMLPRATGTRTKRETNRTKVNGRTQEIQRLIGRSLRSVVDFKKLGERTIWLDCDVIQADGGTRTASITGGFVAMVLAMKKLQREGKISNTLPVTKHVAAISLGIIHQSPYLDLNYKEDSEAEVDMNIVMTSDHQLIEIQGTAEKGFFSKEMLHEMICLVEKGLEPHFEAQLEIIG